MSFRSLDPPRLEAAALDPAQRFLLWALRAWVACCKARALPAAPVSSAFGEIGLAEGAPALEAALVAVARATLRPLAIHCPHCPALSEDEALLVQAVAAAQHRDIAAGHRLLGAILSPASAEGALDCLNRLGLLMALAGLTLPEPDLGPRAALPAPVLTLH